MYIVFRWKWSVKQPIIAGRKKRATSSENKREDQFEDLLEKALENILKNIEDRNQIRVTFEHQGER